MNKHRKFQTAASLGAGLLLLGAALAAWGVSFKLTDSNGNLVTCPAATDVVVNANTGDISANVNCALTAGGGTGDGGVDPTPGSFTLSVSNTGTGSGTVTGTGFNCGTDCTETYPENTPINVTLTAAPETGSTFTGWTGAGCSGTGTCTVATTITSNLSVTATFTADSVGDCPAPGPDVTIVDTGTFDGSWPQQTVFPTRQNIAAYKVVVPAGVSAVNTFSTARTSAGLRAKLLVVSECPGSFAPVGGQSRCTAPNPQETSTVTLSTIQNKYRCNLTPGNTYYVNAASKASIEDTGFTCSTTTNCSYFVSRTKN